MFFVLLLSVPDTRPTKEGDWPSVADALRHAQYCVESNPTAHNICVADAETGEVAAEWRNINGRLHRVEETTSNS
jgi:hypothetical protein